MKLKSFSLFIYKKSAKIILLIIIILDLKNMDTILSDTQFWLPSSNNNSTQVI